MFDHIKHVERKTLFNPILPTPYLAGNRLHFSWLPVLVGCHYEIHLAGKINIFTCFQYFRLFYYSED